VNLQFPEEIAPALPFQGFLQYANDEDVALTQARLFLRTPKSFSLRHSDPSPIENTQELVWNLGTLLPGKRGSIDFSGVFFDSLGITERFEATLIYIPENFRSEFSKKSDISFVLKENPIMVSVLGPLQVTIEKSFEYTINIENTTEEDLKNLKLELWYPEGFVLEDSSPNPKEDDKVWIIDSLVKGEKTEITLHGKFRRETSENSRPELLARFYFFSDSMNEYALLKEYRFLQKLFLDQLSIDFLANDSTEDQEVELGSILSYTIVYRNTTEESLQDVKIRLGLQGNIVNWLALDNKKYTIEGTYFIWSKENLPELKEVAPGKESILRIEVPLIPNPEEVSGDEFFVSAKVQASLDLGNTWAVESKEIVSRISTNLLLTGESRYKDSLGNIIGSGPFPLVADKKTNFEIHYVLSNGLAEVNDFSLEIPLGEGVTYEGRMKLSVGNFTEEGNKLIWNINRLPGGVGGLELSFFVGITPDESEIENNILLVSPQMVKAKKKNTKKDIFQEMPSIFIPKD